jgi:hypothetical protein
MDKSFVITWEGFHMFDRSCLKLQQMYLTQNPAGVMVLQPVAVQDIETNLYDECRASMTNRQWKLRLCGNGVELFQVL